MSCLVPGSSALAAGSTDGMPLPAMRLMTGFLSTMLTPSLPSRRMPKVKPLGDGEAALATHDDNGAKTASESGGDPKPVVVWGAAYSGYNKTDNRRTPADTQARAYGVVTGFDKWLSPETSVGLSLGLGRMSWNVEDNNGSGDGRVFQLGAYGRHRSGPLYLSGGVAGAYQDLSTDRTYGSATLKGHLSAYNIGARVEAGLLLPANNVIFAPYGAVQTQWLHTPAYAENGSALLAMSFDKSDTIASRTELGVWVKPDLHAGIGQALRRVRPPRLGPQLQRQPEPRRRHAGAARHHPCDLRRPVGAERRHDHRRHGVRPHRRLVGGEQA